MVDQHEPVEREIGVNEARQAVTGHHVWVVLTAGLILAGIAGIVLYFTVGT
ncbi:hypothetical protein [Alsobacter sp. R-9]